MAAGLADILAGVTKVTTIVSEIGGEADAQARGAEQVQRAVAEMDQVTQQNAASAEQSSSAAAELANQSDQLAGMVSAFKLAGTPARSAPAPAPRRLAPRSGGAARR